MVLCKWCLLMSGNLVKLAMKGFSIWYFHFRKQRWTGYDKYFKIKLSGGAISHGASNEPETYLEPNQTSTRLQTVNCLRKKSTIIDNRPGSKCASLIITLVENSL